MIDENSGPLGTLAKEYGQKNTHDESEANTPLGVLHGRLPPHAIEAERATLCSLLIDADAFEQVALEGLRVQDFYHPAHAAVFEAILTLRHGNRPVNTVTVLDELLHMQKLDREARAREGRARSML